MAGNFFKLSPLLGVGFLKVGHLDHSAMCFGQSATRLGLARFLLNLCAVEHTLSGKRRKERKVEGNIVRSQEKSMPF